MNFDFLGLTKLHLQIRLFVFVPVCPVEDREDVGGDGGREGEGEVGDDGDDLQPGRPGVVLGLVEKPLLHLPHCGHQSDAVAQQGHHANVQAHVGVDDLPLS